MDPISAVGIAAAAVQFFGVAHKTFALCRRLRDGQASVTEHHVEFQTFTREIKESRRNFAAGHTKPAPRRLSELAAKCVVLSEELLKLLEYVSGGKNGIATARKIIRALKEQKRIEKLEVSLKEKEKALNSLLVQDIWRGLDFHAAEQSKNFATLDATVQHVIRTLAKQELSTLDHAEALKKSLTTLRHDIDKRLDKVDVTTNHGVREIKDQVHRQLEESRRIRQWDELCRSLEFPEMHERQDAIKGAVPGTLKWVFGSGADSKDSDDRRLEGRYGQWDNLEDWLRHQTGVYWLSGKLGSGKSTLMAHIVDDHRTKSALEQWSRDCRILAAFFWRPGSILQKSIVGLLRSLLHQLCSMQGESNLIEGLLKEFPSDLRWNERTLTRSLSRALEILQPAGFCIFIDGLDEYVGDYDQLVDLIFCIQQFENVKLCVSSRPEVQLSHRLSNCYKLRLQDLNEPDIRKFVEAKLSRIQVELSSLGVETIRAQIVRRAEGVFLWAVLTTQAIIRGTVSADDAETLLKRIQTIPQPMNDLFKAMIGNIDEAHKESLAFYLKLMELKPYMKYHRSRLLSVAIVAAVRSNHPVASMAQFERSCQQVETQIVAQSAGLLEIVYTPLYPGQSWADEKVAIDGYVIGIGESNDTTSQHPSYRPHVEHRTRFQYRNILEYEMKVMGWVHRSAHDFLSDPATIVQLGLPPITVDQAIHQLVAGAVNYLLLAPSFQKVRGELGYFSTSRRLVCIFEAVRLLRRDFPSATLVAMDILYRAFVEILDTELADFESSGEFDDFDSRVWPDYRKKLPDTEFRFWMYCIFYGCGFYLSNRMHLVPFESYGSLLAMSLERLQNRLGWSCRYLNSRYRTAWKLLQGFRAYLHTFSPNTSSNVIVLRACSRFDIPSISFRAHQGKGEGPPLEAVHALNFASTFISVCRNATEGSVPWSNEIMHIREMVCLMLNISYSAGIHIEIANRGPKLRLELSPTAFHQCAFKDQVSPMPIPKVPVGLNAGGLRFVCMPWESNAQQGLYMSQNILEEVERFVVVEPSHDTSESLIRRLKLRHVSMTTLGDERLEPHLSYASYSDITDLCRSVENDVLANRQKLDSTQQILALACIRLHLPKLLQQLPRDPNDPGQGLDLET